MSSKRVRLAYKKEKAVLSDVLPYELPVIFSNKDFYKFLVNNGIEISGSRIQWYKKNITLIEIIKFIFSIDKNVVPKEEEKYVGPNKKKIQYIDDAKIVRNGVIASPFKYKIRHKEKEFRELSIPHPATQVGFVSFYEEFKELITYYCGASDFSLRAPYKASSYVFFTDRLHLEKVDRTLSDIEVYDAEYENLKSFFVYKKYSNIHKFYESPEFHRYEKRYNRLAKLDISKCFDSIYSHSISWAVLGKEKVKKIYLEPGNKPVEGTFAGKFDRLMQAANGKETNGIIIGPEFSRIFAEIILQRIDVNVKRDLSASKINAKHKIDYEIFRYVDDYFIFYNEEKVRNLIEDTLQKELIEYKLHLNTLKSKTYKKPIITEITIAKNRIVKLFEKRLSYKHKKKNDTDVYKISLSSKKLITEFKTLLVEADVKYQDILNWSLSIIEIRLDSIFKTYTKIDKSSFVDRDIYFFLVNLIDFIFFIYSVGPKPNTTLRVCRVIAKITEFGDTTFRKKSLSSEITKEIYGNIIFLLNKFKHEKNTQVESLYLLVQLSELGKDYRLDEDEVCKYLAIDNVSNISEYQHFNYLTITVLFFYIQNIPTYTKLKKSLEKLLLFKYESLGKGVARDCELTLLLLDVCSCPYVSKRLKRKLLKTAGFESKAAINELVDNQLNWFINWRGFDYIKALDAKKSLEVY